MQLDYDSVRKRVKFVNIEKEIRRNIALHRLCIYSFTVERI